MKFRIEERGTQKDLGLEFDSLAEAHGHLDKQGSTDKEYIILTIVKPDNRYVEDSSVAIIDRLGSEWFLATYDWGIRLSATPKIHLERGHLPNMGLQTVLEVYNNNLLSSMAGCIYLCKNKLDTNYMDELLITTNNDYPIVIAGNERWRKQFESER